VRPCRDPSSTSISGRADKVCADIGQIGLASRLRARWLRDPEPDDYALVRALFAVEGERSRALDDGGGETMKALGYLLWRYGRKEDVFLMLDTMYISMDTHACLDAMMITLRTPRQEMLEYFEGEAKTWEPSRRDRQDLRRFDGALLPWLRWPFRRTRRRMSVDEASEPDSSLRILRLRAPATNKGAYATLVVQLDRAALRVREGDTDADGDTPACAP
jgi:hypothetical protein